MTSTTLYTLRPVVRIGNAHRVHIEEGRGGPGGMLTATICGQVRFTNDVWHASGEPTCGHCRRIATCARGHVVCGTPELCAALS